MLGNAGASSTITILLLGSGVALCACTLYGCYVVFDRLQTRAASTRGRQRWITIGLAAFVGGVALLVFWCCFALSAGLMQALGLNL